MGRNMTLPPTAVATGLMALMGASVSVQAKPQTRINDSGMVQCLSAANQLSKQCVGSDQDGEFGRDVTKHSNKDGHVGFSFIKVCKSGEAGVKGACSKEAVLGTGPNDCGCTRDKVTGLTWEVKTNDGGYRDADLTYTQTARHQPGDASEFGVLVNGQGLCGAKDWRLPTALELQSLADQGLPGSIGLAIDPAWFPNQRPFPCWSGDIFAYIHDHGWLLDFSNGSVSDQGRSSPWPAMRGRGASLGGPQRFVPDGAEVTDTLMGMIWRRCALGQTWSGSACTGTATWVDWDGAIAAARDTASNTGLPWRLPSLKEANSLADRSQYAPSVDRVAFPWTQSLALWSSTPASDMPGEVWIGDTQYGTAYHFDRHYGYNAALLVRPAT
jgi:hypothetical protein